MNALDLVLLRAGWTPLQLGLPDDVYDPAAPRGIPARDRIDTRSDCRGRGAKMKPETIEDFVARGLRAQQAVDRIIKNAQTEGQNEAQRESERDLVEGAERERDERRKQNG
jgi:hypothetical protein